MQERIQNLSKRAGKATEERRKDWKKRRKKKIERLEKIGGVIKIVRIIKSTLRKQFR